MGLPAALKLQPFEKSGTMKIQTCVIEPQIAANNFVRYVLEKRAILHSDSIFTFSLQTHPDQANAQPCMPTNTGIACLIKNCTLRLGNVVVSRTQDWAHYDTLAKSFVGAEERTLKGTVIRGVLDTMRPSTHTEGTFVMQNADYATFEQSITPTQLNLANDPIFSIRLSELFPALQGMQIPLGHMEDNMVVEFELNTQGPGQQGILAKFSAPPPDDECVVTPKYDEMTMLADYLSFSDATFEEIDDEVNGGKGLVMPFHEIVTIRGHIPEQNPAPAQGEIIEQSVTQELGLAGRTVKSIAVADAPTTYIQAAKNDMADEIAGVFASQGFSVQSETQVKVNDLNVFSRPITSVTTHMIEAEKAFNGSLSVTRPEYELGASVHFEANDAYINTDLIDTNVQFNGTEMNNLANKRHVEGVSLLTDPVTMKGTSIIDKPIRYERVIKRTEDQEDAMTSRYYCAVEKAFAIKDGQVLVVA